MRRSSWLARLLEAGHTRGSWLCDLGVVRKHRREHTTIDMLSSQVRRARAKATILVQRQTATIVQDRELVHIDVHPPMVPARQLRPRTQANDRDTHTVNDSATSPARRIGRCPVARL